MLPGIPSFLVVQCTSRNIDWFIFSIGNELSEKTHTGCFTIPRVCLLGYATSVKSVVFS